MAPSTWSSLYDNDGTIHTGNFTIEPGELAYDVWVGGVQATSTNMRNITGENITSGTVSYNPATNTVMLNNAHITSSNDNGIYIRTAEPAKIYFNGTDNQIGAPGDSIKNGINCEGERPSAKYPPEGWLMWQS